MYGIHPRPILHRNADHGSRGANRAGLIINPCTANDEALLEVLLHSRISNTTLMEGGVGKRVEEQGQIRFTGFRQFDAGCYDTLGKLSKGMERVPVREYVYETQRGGRISRRGECMPMP